MKFHGDIGYAQARIQARETKKARRLYGIGYSTGKHYGECGIGRAISGPKNKAHPSSEGSLVPAWTRGI
jgi:hypothetical protein